MASIRRLTAVIMSVTVAALVVHVDAPRASAWCDTLGKRWFNAAPHQAFASAAIPAGFRGAVKNGVSNWNGVPNSVWNITYVAPGAPGQPADGGWINWGGLAVGDPPGVTQVVWGADNFIDSATTWYNATYTWNADGVMNQAQRKADVTTVGLHELGHWLRLDHPSACGPMDAGEVAAVMNPNWQTKWVLAADDRAASAAKY